MRSSRHTSARRNRAFSTACPVRRGSPTMKRDGCPRRTRTTPPRPTGLGSCGARRIWWYTCKMTSATGRATRPNDGARRKRLSGIYTNGCSRSSRRGSRPRCRIMRPTTPSQRLYATRHSYSRASRGTGTGMSSCCMRICKWATRIPRYPKEQRGGRPWAKR